MERQACVYIMTNKRNGTLYIGVTSCLVIRVWQHKNKQVEGFTQRYSLDKLVWYGVHETMMSAIETEKRMKAWRRAWKLNVIEQMNPDWLDLYETIL